MPQLNKGGKFVFGWSEIKNDYEVNIPPQAIKEYNIVSEGRVILISGSKATGGVVVSRLSLFENSIFNHIFDKYPDLRTYETNELELLPYKGRLYTWTFITSEGKLKLSKMFLDKLSLSIGNRLMVIRSSDIAFVMGAKGPLIKKGKEFNGEILQF